MTPREGGCASVSGVCPVEGICHGVVEVAQHVAQFGSVAGQILIDLIVEGILQLEILTPY